ncbi:ubiquitin carboxyl-terminal hydrolase MINDY-3-like [Macadamia integrifolia]|uniref:ubiquitin carboxyl-terminal hydrolase MINDY-3-like n=1 Tax=Macadamia integrifolia TaxID=60698 RepID=UPI001C4FEA60|nr:ubiquitin carboxyl-terminal hydrolase MINDY-3-like [Macadamia integrifolia]
MGDQEEEELRMALHMSMQNSPPEAKRSKPRENAGATTVSATPEVSPEAKNRKLQRELMAAAAEKRMIMAKSLVAAKGEKSVKVAAPEKDVPIIKAEKDVVTRSISQKSGARSPVEGGKDLNLGEELSPEAANQLFSMVFGSGVSRDILAQWTNQGIRFSADPETCMGLVQHEGGPCGVLATIQAFVLKYLLFFPDEIGKRSPNMPQQNLGSRSFSQSDSATLGNFASLTEDGKTRALVQSMVEILFLCGSKKRAMIATLSILGQATEEGSEYGQKDEIVAKALGGLSIESASDVQKVLRVNTYTSWMSAFHSLQKMLPVFQSRMGAMLFLISALLSRGLESVQADRDDLSLPLVTAPFGHASQEIVNLLLCGQAVPNVFDGRMDLGGEMFLKGIPTSVDVGFLSLLESFNFCKVGQHLKRPKWPIWVVGSESHYTVLFAFDTRVQDENELEERESQIRRAFDAQDQSGGGGFISVEGLHQVLREININLPTEKLDHLCSSGFIVWSEFWQVLLELDKSLGGLKDSSGLMGKKLFDLYHFNGIAKSVLNGNQAASGGVISMQRPRLSKLRVSVPPRWTPEEFMADVTVPSNTGTEDPTGKDTVVEVTHPEPPQHAPLVDCIRTRWPRAVCNWVGDPPSIV